MQKEGVIITLILLQSIDNEEALNGEKLLSSKSITCSVPEQWGGGGIC